MLLARGTFGGAYFWWMGPPSGKSSINAWIKILGKLRTAMLVWNSTSFHQAHHHHLRRMCEKIVPTVESCMSKLLCSETVSWEWKKAQVHYRHTACISTPPTSQQPDTTHTSLLKLRFFYYFLKQLFLIAESFLSFVVKLNLLPLWMNCIPFSHVWKEIYGYSLLHF